MKEMLSIAAAIKALQELEKEFILATVVRVQGSSYRKPGARMLLTTDGTQSWGMVSGGCLEQDVLLRAQQAAKEKKSQWVRYDSTGEEDAVFGTGLGCKGIVDVVIEPLSSERSLAFSRFILQVAANRKGGVIATAVHSPGTRSPIEENRSFLFSNSDPHPIPFASPPWPLKYLPQVQDCFQSKNSFYRPIRIHQHDVEFFFEYIPPPLNLIIFGGWLDVIPLLKTAKVMGWKTTVVDVRKRQPSLQRFHEADSILLMEADQAVDALTFDERTAVILMNHHLHHDMDCLRAILPQGLNYIGMLGPKRRTMEIIEKIHGIQSQNLECIHGPVGLDLGAQTPEEIALAITSEIIAIFNRPSTNPGKNKLSLIQIFQDHVLLDAP